MEVVASTLARARLLSTEENNSVDDGRIFRSYFNVRGCIMHGQQFDFDYTEEDDLKNIGEPTWFDYVLDLGIAAVFVGIIVILVG